MDFNRAQISAALSLLGLNQNDLAEGVGMTRPSITRILSADGHPKEETARRIYRYLEDKGVEFLDQDGVRRRREDIKVYEGVEGYKAFCDDRYNTALNSTQDYLYLGGRQDDFRTAVGDEYQKFHMNRMKSLTHFKMRGLRPLSDMARPNADYIEYRALPDDQFPGTPFYVYGGKFAIIRFKPELRVIVIQDREISQAYRTQFEVLWAVARPIREAGND